MPNRHCWSCPLGIGLGIAYAIYMVVRIRDEVMDGSALDDAITTALRTTGAGFVTYVVMVGGMLPWVFSPLLFHNEMSVLLILLMMSANMIAGLLILPAAIAWSRPRFITRYEQTAPRAAPTVAAPATHATS